MNFDSRIFDKLTDAIKNDKLIIFVGAGLSYDLVNTENQKLEGWTNLVKSILIKFSIKEPKLTALLPLCDILNPIQILENIDYILAISSNINKNDIKLYVKDFFDLGKNNNLSLYEGITKLSNKIITTNYDRAIELANYELEKCVTIPGKNHEIAELKKNNPFLFKLHGCISDLDSLVLFSDDYKNLYENDNLDSRHALKAFDNLVYNNTILFLGCGMGDYQINHFFKELKKLEGDNFNNHFIISIELPHQDLNFLNHIKIDSFDEISDIINILYKKKLLFNKEKADSKADYERVKLELIQKKSANNLVILELFSEANDFYHKKDYRNQINKYQQIDKLEPRKSVTIYSNWGNALHLLAIDENNESLFFKAIEIFKIAIEIESKFGSAYFNWGNTLAELAIRTDDLDKSKIFFFECFEKYKLANSYLSLNADICICWAGILTKYAQKFESEYYFSKSIEMYHKAEKLCKKTYHPKKIESDLYFSWGSAICVYAQFKGDYLLYKPSFEKFNLAININRDHEFAYLEWGHALAICGRIEKSTSILEDSIKKFEEAIRINPEHGLTYQQIANSLLEIGLLTNNLEKLFGANKNYENAIKHMLPNINTFGNWAASLIKIGEITKKEKYFIEAFEKFNQAKDLGPLDMNIYNNWGTAYVKLADIKNESILYDYALNKYTKARNLGFNYSYICKLYCHKGDKENTLKYLDLCLEEGSLTRLEVLNDKEWPNFKDDIDFINILNKYQC